MTLHNGLTLFIALAGLMFLILNQMTPNYYEELRRPKFVSLLPQDMSPLVEKEVTLLPCNCNRTLYLMLNNKTSTDSQSNSSVSSCSDWATARGPGQRVGSYSVYGKFPGEYYDGVVHQLTRLKEVYPGWILRLYLDLSRPDVQEWACSLACQNKHLDLCDVNNLPELGNLSTYFGMIWRFTVVGDALVDRYLVRDTDSPIIQREVNAVNEWFRSGKCFHVMRDHYFHGVPMLGGMWGGCNTWQLSTFQEIRKHLLITTASFGKDQNVLKTYMWPEVKKNVLPHDSYTCKFFPGSKPFPTERENFTFVGMRTYRKRYELDHMDKLCPQECRPPDHQDWEYC